MQRWARSGALAALAIAAAMPVHAQRNRDAGPADRCEATDCFNQLQIRNLEVIDKTTLLIYVGSQRCPFLVEMTGVFCDLTFLPPFQVVFRPTRQQSARTPPIVGGVGTAPDGGGPIEQTRICASDIDMGLPADRFNTAIGGVDGDPGGLSCRIQNVRSLTDDERLQIYVDNEIVAPPPPFGSGTVETPEDPEEPEAQPAEDSDSRSRRRRDDDDRRRRRDRDDDE